MLEKTVFYTESDMRAVASLSDFLPNKIFDAHAHLFSSDFLPSAHAEGEVSIADLETYFENMSVMLSSPGELRINMITFPDPAMADLSLGHLKRSDDFIVEQLSKKEGNVGGGKADIFRAPLPESRRKERGKHAPAVKVADGEQIKKSK